MAGTPVAGLDANKSGNLSSYKVGVVYKPVANGSIYAAFATASEPPGGNNLAFSSSTSHSDNPIFDPQKARTVEMRTKWNALGDQLRLSAALFRTVVTNLVVQDPVDLQYYKIGRERVQGVELGAVGQIPPHWAVTAGYTVMNTTADSGIVSSSSTSSAPARTVRTRWPTCPKAHSRHGRRGNCRRISPLAPAPATRAKCSAGTTVRWVHPSSRRPTGYSMPWRATQSTDTRAFN